MTKAESAAWKLYPERKSLSAGKYAPNLHLRKAFLQGYDKAKKDLGWHSIEESLPQINEEVIVLIDTAPYHSIACAHIVDKEIVENFNGWNIPGVKYWMHYPKILEI